MRVCCTSRVVRTRPVAHHTPPKSKRWHDLARSGEGISGARFQTAFGWGKAFDYHPTISLCAGHFTRKPEFSREPRDSSSEKRKPYCLQPRTSYPSHPSSRTRCTAVDANKNGRKRLITHAEFWKLDWDFAASLCVWKLNFNRAGSYVCPSSTKKRGYIALRVRWGQKWDVMTLS